MNLLSVSIYLPFWIFHINEITQYVVFRDSLHSLSRLFSNSICVVAWVVLHSFLLPNNIPLYGHSTFVDQLMDIWVLSTFMYKFLCVYKFSLLWGIYLGAELLHPIATLCLTLWGTTQLSSKAAAPFSFLPAVYEGTNFSKSLPTLVLIWLFDSRNLSGCEVESHCSFFLLLLFLIN